MATGTAEVVKVSAKDHEVSLRGPFGGVHNLDVREGIKGDPAKTLKVGDYVEFRIIKPIAIAIRKGG
jgi:exosome complex RNA-binding protein Rrp4